ncbi:MAG: type II toxin-antitoxin system TacA family antitoxin [Microthrixaceae bacterium]
MSETLTGRLNFRLSSEQERALRDAAALTGQSVSGFVLSSAVERAHELLERANTIELSDAAFRRFVGALDEPAEVVPELVRLFERNSRIPR